MTSNITRRFKAGLIALALVLSQVVLPVQSAYATQGSNSGPNPGNGGGSNSGSSSPEDKEKKEDEKLNEKVFVCKYVKTPGATEVAHHVISVAVNKQHDYKPGDFFTDAQELSYVISYDNGQAEPSTAICPKYVELPARPTANDPCNPTDDDISNVSWGIHPDTDAYYWTLNSNGSLTVTAKAGYKFRTGSETFTSYTYVLPEDNGNVCEGSIVRILPAPAAQDLCGLSNVRWIVPEDDATYDWTLNENGSLSVVIKGSGVFADGKTTHTFELPADEGEYCIIGTPAVPEVTDECNVDDEDNAYWNKPADSASVAWTINTDGELIATATGDYAFQGGQKVINYGQAQDDSEACPVEPPAVCTVSDNTFDRMWLFEGDLFPEAGAFPEGGVPGTFSFKNDGLYLSTPAEESYVYGLIDAGKTPLGEIGTMSYMTLRRPTSTGATYLVPAYIIFADRDGNMATTNDSLYFFYEPVYNGSVQTGAWQTWNVLNGGNSKWWGSGNANPDRTWNDLLAQYPDAVALAYGFNQGASNPLTDSAVQDIEFDCATTTFAAAEQGGQGGGTPAPTTSVVPTVPVTPVVAAPVVAAGGAGASLPEELPMTGPNGSVLGTWIALLAAILTYGAVYYLQPKKRFEQ